MSEPGWYPDPGGHKGMFRYWDGSRWSPNVSPSPGGTPPTPAGGGGFDPTRPLTPTTQTGPRLQPGAVPPGRAAGMPPGAGGGGGRRLWWVAGIAAAVVLVVVLALAVRGGMGTIAGGKKTTPGVVGQRDVCPRITAAPTAPGKGTSRDGRVFGGKLSYPLLPPPWSAPSPDSRVPFGREVATQSVNVERNTDPRYDWDSWVASVLVAELVAGDGFYEPKQGAEIVVKCVVGAFYGNSKVDRNDTVNRAEKVQGRDAWLIESHLSFDVPGLNTKGELLVVLIVATGEGEASLYYASIPDTARQWEAPARQAMSDLRVEG
ncbi:hypothetical protein GCM10027418_25710 [Mariniluteicoccus endophyticus]